MLDQLRPPPGGSILEIGAATAITPPCWPRWWGRRAGWSHRHPSRGAGEAREHLSGAGITNAEVICGDGAVGWPGGAPYDGIIATAGVTDLAPAWVTQLASRGGWWCRCPSGAPSSAWPSPGPGGHLRSVAVCDCGFMPLTGVMPDTNRREPVPGHPGTLHAMVGTELDIGLVTAALDDPRPAARTGITAPAEQVLGSLRRWLAFHEPAGCSPTSAPRTAPMPAAFRPCSSSSTRTGRGNPALASSAPPGSPPSTSQPW